MTRRDFYKRIEDLNFSELGEECKILDLLPVPTRKDNRIKALKKYAKDKLPCCLCTGHCIKKCPCIKCTKDCKSCYNRRHTNPQEFVFSEGNTKIFKFIQELIITTEQILNEVEFSILSSQSDWEKWWQIQLYIKLYINYRQDGSQENLLFTREERIEGTRCHCDFYFRLKSGHNYIGFWVELKQNSDEEILIDNMKNDCKKLNDNVNSKNYKETHVFGITLGVNPVENMWKVRGSIFRISKSKSNKEYVINLIWYF